MNETIEISLYNFRQFYGKQKIEFAKGTQNITIIFGENGKGKTGIFRALMFGFYGSTHIQQDNPKDAIHLVNFIALEKMRICQLMLMLRSYLKRITKHTG